MKRTRIKICGLTRAEDVRAAVAAGADAVGFVFYPPSPRAVTVEQASALCSLLPPFVSAIGLFVNETRATIEETISRVPLSAIQFHGDETEQDCLGFRLPYLKAARVVPELDLLNYAAQFPSAAGLLLDAFVEGYGGGGKSFDWDLIPAALPLPIVLSGGLTPANVVAAIEKAKPWAVDVSSGVEAGKGIKDASLIEAFIAGVRNADSRRGE